MAPVLRGGNSHNATWDGPERRFGLRTLGLVLVLGLCNQPPLGDVCCSESLRLQGIARGLTLFHPAPVCSWPWSRTGGRSSTAVRNAAYRPDCAGRERCLRAAGSKPQTTGGWCTWTDDERPDVRADAWGSPSSEAGYARRDELERVNVRLVGGFHFENHFARGRGG